MDILHKLKEFFTIQDSNDSMDIETFGTSKTLKSKEHELKFLREDDSERPPTLTVNLKLEKPDIIVVENMDSIDTDALVFHVIDQNTALSKFHI